VVLFVRVLNRDGVTAVDQPRWVQRRFRDVRPCLRRRDPADIEDARNLAELGDFCRRMGRDARQGEVGLVVGDEYFAIRDFAEE